jgi:hypothetical protein
MPNPKTLGAIVAVVMIVLIANEVLARRGMSVVGRAADLLTPSNPPVTP